MKMLLAWSAAIALIPAFIGPLPAQARALTATLCNGGTITIPLDQPPPPPGSTPCCAKGCQGSSSSRKRIDRTQ